MAQVQTGKHGSTSSESESPAKRICDHVDSLQVVKKYLVEKNMEFMRLTTAVGERISMFSNVRDGSRILVHIYNPIPPSTMPKHWVMFEVSYQRQKEQSEIWETLRVHPTKRSGPLFLVLRGLNKRIRGCRFEFSTSGTNELLFTAAASIDNCEKVARILSVLERSIWKYLSGIFDAVNNLDTSNNPFKILESKGVHIPSACRW